MELEYNYNVVGWHPRTDISMGRWGLCYSVAARARGLASMQ